MLRNSSVQVNVVVGNVILMVVIVVVKVLMLPRSFGEGYVVLN
jgi:hypothetical protein